MSAIGAVADALGEPGYRTAIALNVSFLCSAEVAHYGTSRSLMSTQGQKRGAPPEANVRILASTEAGRAGKEVH